MRKIGFYGGLAIAGFLSVLSGCSNGRNTDYTATMSADSLMTLTQFHTFQYFWEGAESNSLLARERIHLDEPEVDAHIVTSGGSGFGLMALIVGAERGFITRKQLLDRLSRNIAFLEEADRFHGVWPHWMDGRTGKVVPFSDKDDGGDLVETSFLAAGLITVRQYLDDQKENEKQLVGRINNLLRSIEWNWYTQGQQTLYWHWSPTNEWEMNFAIDGYNECLITYVMAATSDSFSIKPEVYHKGWAGEGEIKSRNKAYGVPLLLAHNYAEEFGGPLFWAHYSFLGLDPRGLKDRYADYQAVNRNHARINYLWCMDNPKQYDGYGPAWGLTSSYSLNFYHGHKPGNDDLGVISPTAALSSFPYTPDESRKALEYFYYVLEDDLWGPYGFYDAYSETEDWYIERYLAIDQGPIVVMMENYRTGLIWDLFMSAPEVRRGLYSLGFTFK